MKILQRIILCLLFVLLPVSLFVSCAEDESTSSSAVPTSDDTSGEASEDPFPLESKHFDKTLTVLCCERHVYGVLQFVPNEEQTFMAVSEAVKVRNDLIEENYGLKIEAIPARFPIDELKLSVQAQSDDYDIICDTTMGLMSAIPEATFTALDGHIDLNNPWWDKSASDLLTFSDKHYLLSGDAILTDDDYTYLMLFNKDVYEKNASLTATYGDLYDLVRNGKWTWDVLADMMKTVAAPDEFGSWSVDGTFGMVGSANAANVFMNAAGLLPAEMTPSGGIQITINDQEHVGTFGEVYDLLHNKQQVLFAENAENSFDTVNDVFRNGRALFYCTHAGTISEFKNDNDLNISFGVLPIPKRTETQEKYYHTVNSGNSSVLAIPSTNVEDLEASCYLLELLGYYGHYGRSTSFQNINDAYYETTLKLQAVEESDDAEMLDLVFNNRIYDPFSLWGSWGSPSLGQLQGVVILHDTNDLVAQFDAGQSAIEAAIEKTLEAFRNIE